MNRNFGGFGGGNNMQALMQQAKRMQEEAMKNKEELENSVFEGTASGGLVKVEINGKYDLVSVKIDKSVVDPEDTEMLEDLIVAGFNDAKAKADAMKNEKLGALGGLI